MMAASSSDRGADRPTLGFIGLGAMGAPISTALLEAGYALHVHDVDGEAVARLRERGARPASSAQAVADVAEVVFTSLPSPAILEAVISSDDGVLAGSAVRVIVELSTVGASAAEAMAAAAAARGVGYLDAPISGGVAGAEARTLAIMAAGDRALFERSRSMLETFGSSVFHVGDRPGQGQLAKVLNNLLSATAMLATAEAAAVAARAGLNVGTLLEVISVSSGRNSATIDKFPKHVLTGRFASGFRADLMAKDVELCLAEARREKVPMLVGGLVQQLWTLAAAQLEAGADHTEIVRLVETWGDVTVAPSAG